MTQPLGRLCNRILWITTAAWPPKDIYMGAATRSHLLTAMGWSPSPRKHPLLVASFRRGCGCLRGRTFSNPTAPIGGRNSLTPSHTPISRYLVVRAARAVVYWPSISEHGWRVSRLDSTPVRPDTSKTRVGMIGSPIPSDIKTPPESTAGFTPLPIGKRVTKHLPGQAPRGCGGYFCLRKRCMPPACHVEHC